MAIMYGIALYCNDTYGGGVVVIPIQWKFKDAKLSITKQNAISKETRQLIFLLRSEMSDVKIKYEMLHHGNFKDIARKFKENMDIRDN